MGQTFYDENGKRVTKMELQRRQFLETQRQIHRDRGNIPAMTSTEQKPTASAEKLCKRLRNVADDLAFKRGDENLIICWRQSADLIEARGRAIAALAETVRKIKHGEGCPVVEEWWKATPSDCTCGYNKLHQALADHAAVIKAAS